MVLVGEKYHYVFTDNSGLLQQILSLNQAKILTLDAKKTYLKVDDKNDIAGDFVISGPFSILPDEDKRILKRLGFFPDKEDVVTIKIGILGKRYVARYLGQNLANLKTAHELKIYYDGKNDVVTGVGKAAITPVAVTLDAVLLIGKVAIYPFSL